MTVTEQAIIKCDGEALGCGAVLDLEYRPVMAGYGSHTDQIRSRVGREGWLIVEQMGAETMLFCSAHCLAHYAAGRIDCGLVPADSGSWPGWVLDADEVRAIHHAFAADGTLAGQKLLIERLMSKHEMMARMGIDPYATETETETELPSEIRAATTPSSARAGDVWAQEAEGETD